MNAANTTRHQNAAVLSTTNVATTDSAATTSANDVVMMPPGVRYGRGMPGSRTRNTMWLTIISTYERAAPNTAMFSSIAP